jgi:hypothetical protein
VVTDESDPLFMGADGHSNNTGELEGIAEAVLCQWLKDTERSLSESPVLFCLDSEYAANAIQRTSQVNAVLIDEGKQLYLEEARHRAGGFSLTFPLAATVRYLETRERMSLRREVRPT